MSFKIGLVGLPNVGKSSLFHFLTKKKDVVIANYPFATIDPNVGLMLLLDPRLEKLSAYWKSRKTTPSVIEIVDIAGLVKGASQGSGLGNEFLSYIREVDLIIHVLRGFPEKEIIHVEKSVNPIRDYEIIQLELILADIQQIKKRLEKLKVKDEKTQQEKELWRSIEAKLEQEIPLSQLTLSPAEKKIIQSYNFLTAKPVFCLVNYSGDKSEVNEWEKYAQTKQLTSFPLAIKLASEMAKFSLAEQKELGWTTTDLSHLVASIKQLLKLKTFFTVGEDETKSWLTPTKQKARQCAGLIHSDLEKGFIRVEVYNYTDWQQFPHPSQLKKTGKIRKEGENYIIKEGDICHFLFSKR